MEMIKNILRKLSHKQALILFWSCLGVFLFGPLLSMSLAYLDPVKFEPFVNHPIFFVLGIASFVCMFPVIILIPLIGSGFFHNKKNYWVNLPHSSGGNDYGM